VIDTGNGPRPTQPVAPGTPEHAARVEAEAVRLYRAYHSALDAFMEGETEQQAYEDTCRTLFGTASYVLFTMDRLISVMMKQLQNIIEDEDTGTLLSLFAATRSRGGRMTESLYRGFARAVLGDAHCLRLAMTYPSRNVAITLLEQPEDDPETAADASASSSSNGGTATAAATEDAMDVDGKDGKVDGDAATSSAAAPAAGDAGAAGEGAAAEGATAATSSSAAESTGPGAEGTDPAKHFSRWSEYLRRFGSAEADDLDPREHRLFLPRTLARFATSRAAVDNCDVRNGLRVSVNVNTFRLAFVESTGDYLFRRGGNRAAHESTAGAQAEARIAKWRAIHKVRAEEAGFSVDDKLPTA
jgi:hypothetical protein